MTIDEKLQDEVRQLHAQICAGLADPTRIMILYSLAEQSRSVSDIQKLLKLSQSTVSRHLQVLRARQLVSATREGPNVYYALVDKRVIEALDLLRAVLADQIVHQAGLVERSDPNQ